MNSLNSYLRHVAVLATFFLSLISLTAADAVTVKKVDFGTARLPGGSQTDEWIEILIELQGGPNESKTARNPAFNENIKVEFFLCYQVDPEPGAKGKDKTFYHFKSAVEISALERGKTADVHFFIPPEIKRLYNFSSSRAFAHAVILSVDGTEIPPTASGDSLSTSVRTPDKLKSFRAACDLKSAESEGVMVPIYETLFWNVTLEGGKRFKNVPSYRKPKGK